MLPDPTQNYATWHSPRTPRPPKPTPAAAAAVSSPVPASVSEEVAVVVVLESGAGCRTGSRPEPDRSKLRRQTFFLQLKSNTASYEGFGKCEG